MNDKLPLTVGRLAMSRDEWITALRSHAYQSGVLTATLESSIETMRSVRSAITGKSARDGQLRSKLTDEINRAECRLAEIDEAASSPPPTTVKKGGTI